jgi:type IV secretory pathway VirD2 relaxase
MRTVIKHSYVRAGDDGPGCARAHIRYIQHRPGKDLDNKDYRPFFSKDSDNLFYSHATRHLPEQAGPVTIHKIILSPGVDQADLKAFTREVMSSLEAHITRSLCWFATEHHNTDHPHVHIVIMGTDDFGTRVHFNVSAYKSARAAGDRYLDRAGL